MSVYTVWRCKLFHQQIEPIFWCTEICKHFDPRHENYDVMNVCNKAHCVVVHDNFHGTYPRAPTCKSGRM
jgi:hypothetical protein